MVRNPTARRLLVSSLVPGLAAGLFVVAAVAAASTRSTSQADRHAVREGGSLVVGSPAFDFIDPALALDPITSAACAPCMQAMWAVADATCAMLFRYPVTVPPVSDYRLVPEVATSVPTPSRDGKNYTFTIRKGLRFSTGATLTAANYKRAFDRVLNPATNSPAARYFEDVAGVRAAGDQLIVRLTKRVPDFPARMTMAYLCPVPTDLPIAPEGVGAPLPGSGPYYVAEFIRGDRVVLRRNRYYRGSRPHHLDQIVVQVGDPLATIAHKVEAGQLDVALALPGAVEAGIAERHGVNKQQFFSIRGADMFYTLMNTERPLFKNNPKLRQAVNFALDRTAMLRVLGAASGSRSDSYLPSGLPGYRDAHPYPVRYPNLAKARALGEGHLRSGKAVMYVTDSIAVFGAVAHAQIVQYDLKQIGIDVEIRQFPTTILDTKLATRGEPFDLANIRYLVAWVDPSQYVDLLLDGRTIKPTGNINRSYFNSPHFNRLIDQARRLSGLARYDAYGKLAIDIARTAAPMATFINRSHRFFVSSRVGCVRATGVAAHGVDLAGLCLK
jgi:peptide/nickel transport system substrate-binding protein